MNCDNFDENSGNTCWRERNHRGFCMFDAEPVPVPPDGLLTDRERTNFESGVWNILGGGSEGREPIACLWAAYKRVETELRVAEGRLDHIREVCEEADKKVYAEDIIAILERE